MVETPPFPADKQTYEQTGSSKKVHRGNIAIQNKHTYSRKIKYCDPYKIES